MFTLQLPQNLKWVKFYHRCKTIKSTIVPECRIYYDHFKEKILFIKHQCKTLHAPFIKYKILEKYINMSNHILIDIAHLHLSKTPKSTE